MDIDVMVSAFVGAFVAVLIVVGTAAYVLYRKLKERLGVMGMF